MKFILLLVVFVTSAMATEFKGSFTALEVEPILNWEYVSDTCIRTEHSQCSCDEQGCQTCSYDYYYECGSDQWVRKGSKPLYELEVEYAIKVTGDSHVVPVLTAAKEIDHNFGPETLHNTFFNRPTSSLMITALNLKVEVIQIIEAIQPPGKKRLIITAEWVVLDQKKINQAFKRSTIQKKKDIVLDDSLQSLPLNLNVCVGTDRILSRNVSMLGCQTATIEELRSGKISLKNINFANARNNRDLVYFFNWSLLGSWLAGYQSSAPFVTIKN